MVAQLDLVKISLLIAANLLASALNSVAAVSYHTYEGDREGLAIIEANENKLEGVYHDSTGSINFVSEAKNGGHFMSITSINGAPIFATEKSRDSSTTTMALGDAKFVSIQNEPGRGLPKYSDYVVPQAFHNHLALAMRQKYIRVPSVLLQQFDSRSANVTRQREIEALISRGDADLIVEAAKALGDAGVMGYESPAALQFYALAMRLDKIKNKMQQAQAMELSMSKANNPFARPISQAKPYGPYSGMLRAQAASLSNSGMQQLPENIQKRETCSECTTGRCPYRGDRSNDCFGMCGRECECWWWLCGDCCVHQGCLEHDQCCVDEGFWSFACLGAPFSFSCSSYSC